MRNKEVRYGDQVTRIGIVIPTLFERPKYLHESIASIRSAGDAHILLSAPEGHELLADYIDLVDSFMPELDHGNLATKIDHALKSLPAECEYLGWLGDDDLLNQGSLGRAAEELTASGVGLVYGSCDYIDESGNKIGRNRSGSWATSLMMFGPFLIPQPGSLWRREAFESINGLDDNFTMAFDHDLAIRLHNHSGSKFLDSNQASFRWHSESLSVSTRWTSVLEASRVRRKHYSGLASICWFVWEPAIILATKFAGDLVNLRIRAKSPS